jgi:glycosyltransferase involved in cell wall biosynthesis
MLLSIVIPTRNRAGFLKNCLASVSREIGDREDVEVIVVDDASATVMREQNGSLCEQYRFSRILLEKRGGAALARNCGINSSRGEWIAFLDDDVRVHEGWLLCLRNVFSSVKKDTVGIEGSVVAEGDGLWDKEVQNRTGRLYLTCHMIYRADVLKNRGGFDEHFNAVVPSCEDHELASRVLRQGSVAFEPSLAVTHSARQVNIVKYVLSGIQRIHSQLQAEYYFYSKQKDAYHLFRFRQTFFGTYKAVLLKHAWTVLRRRPVLSVVRRPLQYSALLISSVVEQITAWCLLPCFLWNYLRPPCNFFYDSIDMLRTTKFWGLERPPFCQTFKVSYSVLKAIFFPVTKKPVYSALSYLKGISHRRMPPALARCFLRIDDVFLDQDDSVLALCEMIATKKIPFLAAVIGSHIMEKRYAPFLQRIVSSKGDIGLHGFVHLGKFGPYNSEVLQMSFPCLSRKVEESLAVFPEQSRPFVFMPPFNAINRDQILYLGKYFKVICGGPETARFTDRTYGPVALANGSWYVPAFYPFYQKAEAMLRSRAVKLLGPRGCNICFAVHMPEEAKNGFKALSELIDMISANLTSWTIFQKNGSTWP